MAINIATLSVLMIAIMLGAFGQVLFKIGSSSLNGGVINYIILFITNKCLFLGLVLYGISTLLYVNCLKKIDLGIAYPAVSLGYIIVLILSHFILGEPFSMNKILGTCIIIFGVCVLFIK